MKIISIVIFLISISELTLLSFFISRLLNLKRHIIPITVLTIAQIAITLYTSRTIGDEWMSIFNLISLNLFLVFIGILYRFFNIRKVETQAEKEIEKKEISNENNIQEIKELSSRFISLIEGSGRELRTIITTIVGSIGLLRDTVLTDLQQEYLSDLEKSAENLTSFVSNLTTFAKADLKSIQLNETSTFKIESIFDTLIEKYDILVESNVDVLFNIDPDVPYEVVGDDEYLSILLGCIIDNAVKFTSRGKITLSCRVLMREEKMCTLEIGITDTGIGIPKDRMPFIFTALNNRKANYWFSAGFDPGLGLPTAERLSKLFRDGKLDIKSVVNKGTSVTFTSTFKLPTYTKVKKKNEGKIIVLAKSNYSNSISTLLKRKGYTNVDTHDEDNPLEFLTASYEEGRKYDLLIFTPKFRSSKLLERFLVDFRNKPQFKDIKIMLIVRKYILENSNIEDKVDSFLIKPFLTKLLFKYVGDCLQKNPTDADRINEVKPAGNGGKLTVLIAEDDIFNRKILSKIITRGGHTCMAVNNGLECFVTYKNLEGKIDVIFMDYQMPTLDGLEATKLIRNYESMLNLDRTKIIGFTASEDMKPKCIASGMDGCLLKPVMVSKVYSVLRESTNVE